jgi:hypothetical protein
VRDNDKPHTAVNDLDQLHRWLVQSRAPALDHGDGGAWAAAMTDVMHPPQLDQLLASAQAHAAMDQAPTVSGSLAFTILLELGGFDLEFPPTQVHDTRVKVPEEASVRLPSRLEVRLRDLSPDEIVVLQDAHTVGATTSLLKESNDPEGTYELVCSLVGRGYLELEDKGR